MLCNIPLNDYTRKYLFSCWYIFTNPFGGGVIINNININILDYISSGMPETFFLQCISIHRIAESWWYAQPLLLDIAKLLFKRQCQYPLLPARQLPTLPSNAIGIMKAFNWDYLMVCSGISLFYFDLFL